MQNSPPCGSPLSTHHRSVRINLTMKKATAINWSASHTVSHGLSTHVLKAEYDFDGFNTYVDKTPWADLVRRI